MRTVNKLRSRLGETFVEVLVALLIVALATMLLASMVMASGSIDANTREQDEKFYDAVSALESGVIDTAAGGTVTKNETMTVEWGTGGSSVNVTVDINEQDGLKAYRKGSHEKATVKRRIFTD